MTPYELGIKVTQQRNVPGHLKQAYARGFVGGVIGVTTGLGSNLLQRLGVRRKEEDDYPPRVTSDVASPDHDVR